MPKKSKDRFFVYLPCKPYVKRFLLYNYSLSDSDYKDAVSLSDSFLYQRFRSALHRKSDRWRAKYEKLSRYSETVAIEIKKEDFYSYGWALSDTEVVSFCMILEARAKAMLFTYLDVHRAMGLPLALAIRNFQERFDFPEDVWPSESIRREYNRKGNKMAMGLIADISKNIDKIVLGNLYRCGTISHQAFLEYDTQQNS